MNTLSGASRRSVMACAAAAVFLPAGYARAQTQGIAQASASSASPAADPDAANLAADLAARTDASQHLTIEVRINGAGPYHFVVDTGAERSVIADNVATALGLAPVGRVLVDGIVNKIEADLVTARTLAFGPFTRDNVKLPVLPRSFLIADGYLGLDAIDGNRVTFDFARKLLRIDKSTTLLGALAPSDDTIVVQARGKAGRLRAGHCWIDGVLAAAFLDSGAEISMGNPALKAALTARKTHFKELGPVILTGVTGGETEGVAISFRQIHLQDLMITDGALAIAQTSNFDAWDLGDSPALLIGMNFLRQFARVSIDYRREVIRFELSDASDEAARPKVARA